VDFEQASSMATAPRPFSARRYAAVYGLIGLVLGTVAGYFVFPRVFPAAVIGFGLGWILGRFRWFVGRKA
jgi:hypothetical protein